MPVGTQDPNARQVLARIGTAPSPADSGTDFHVDATVDYFQNSFEQAVPFKITVYPALEEPTKQNSEVVLVTAYTSSTRTGGVSIAQVQPGHDAPGSVDIVETQPGYAGGLPSPAYHLLLADGVSRLLLADAASLFVLAGIGADAQSSIQVMTVDATAGTYTLTFNGYTTSSLNWNDNAATIQAALEALTSIGAGNVAVTGTGPFTVTFQGGLVDTDVPLITATSSLTTGGAATVTVATVTAGSGSANEVQSVTLADSTADGTYTLTFNGYTTAPLYFNQSADGLQRELEALTSIGAGNVDVEGGVGGPYTVEFQGTLGLADQPQMTADATLLAAAGIPEQETIGIDATAGTFRLSADGGTTYTSGLAYNASAATVQSALEGLAAIGTGNCVVTYDDVGFVYTVTWCGALASSAPTELVADASSLTVATNHVTACLRAQDNTTARSIVVGDAVEVTGQTPGPLSSVDFNNGYTLSIDPTRNQVFLAQYVDTGVGTLHVAYPSPNDTASTAQMFLNITVVNGGTGVLSIAWNVGYRFGSVTKITSLAIGAQASYTFVWNSVSWVAMSYNN